MPGGVSEKVKIEMSGDSEGGCPPERLGGSVGAARGLDSTVRLDWNAQPFTPGGGGTRL